MQKKNLISSSSATKQSGVSSSSMTAGRRRRVVEHHKKTMLKVMDPNVHQMTLSRNQDARVNNSDNESVNSSHRLKVKTVTLNRGYEPKIEMKRRMARQSDLIDSLEQSQAQKSTDLLKLKRQIDDQD